MRHYVITISSAGVSVRVSSREKAYIDFLRGSLFLARYIPAISFVDIKKPDAYLSLHKRNDNGYSIAYPRAQYRAPRYNDKDIVSLVELLLERARQEQGIYCLHSASVVLDGQGVIFWGGASGLGKTRMALFVSKASPDIFYSDEKTLVDLYNNTMVGGVGHAYLSKKDLRAQYGNKNFLAVQKKHNMVPIRFFVQPIVTERGYGVVSEQWECNKFAWHLYEESSRKIRATSRRLFNNTVPVQSIDTPKLSLARSSAVNRYVKTHQAFFIKGTERNIDKKIKQIADLSL